VTVSLAPAKLFLTLSSSAAPKFQSQQTSRQQSGDILNHYAIPAIYEVREFVEVGGLIITGPPDLCHIVKLACIPATY